MATSCANPQHSLGGSLSETKREMLDRILLQLGHLSQLEKLYLYLQLPTLKSTSLKPVEQSPCAAPSPKVGLADAQNWLQTHLLEDSSTGITRASVYENYKQFCDRQDIKVLTREDLSKLIYSTFPSVTSKRLGAHGHAKHCYGGLAMRKKLDKPSVKVKCSEKENLKSLLLTQGTSSNLHASTELTKAACFIIIQWAQLLLQIQLPNIHSLAYYLIEQGYVSAETTAALTVLALAPVSSLITKVSTEDSSSVSSPSISTTLSATTTDQASSERTRSRVDPAKNGTGGTREQVKNKLVQKQRSRERQAVLQDRLMQMPRFDPLITESSINSPPSDAATIAEETCQDVKPVSSLLPAASLGITNSPIVAPQSNIIVLSQLPVATRTTATDTPATPTLLSTLITIPQVNPSGATELQTILLPLSNLAESGSTKPETAVTGVGGPLLLSTTAPAANKCIVGTSPTNPISVPNFQGANQIPEVKSPASQNSVLVVSKTSVSNTIPGVSFQAVSSQNGSAQTNVVSVTDSYWTKTRSQTDSASSVLAKLLSAPQSPDQHWDRLTLGHSFKPTFSPKPATGLLLAQRRSGGKTVHTLLEEKRVNTSLTEPSPHRATWTDSRPVCEILKERRRHRSQQQVVQEGQGENTEFQGVGKAGRRQLKPKNSREAQSAPCTPISGVLEYYDDASPQQSPLLINTPLFFPSAQPQNTHFLPSEQCKLPVRSNIHLEKNNNQHSPHSNHSGKGKSVSFKDEPSEFEIIPQNSAPGHSVVNENQFYAGSTWGGGDGQMKLEYVDTSYDYQSAALNPANQWAPGNDPLLGQPTRLWGNDGAPQAQGPSSTFVPIDNVASSASVLPVRPQAIAAVTSSAIKSCSSQSYQVPVVTAMAGDNEVQGSWHDNALLQSSFIPYGSQNDSESEKSDSGIGTSCAQSPVSSGFASMENIRPLGKRNIEADHSAWLAKRQRHLSDQSGLKRGGRPVGGGSQLAALLASDDNVGLAKISPKPLLTPLLTPQSSFCPEVHHIMSGTDVQLGPASAGGVWGQESGSEFRSHSVPLDQVWGEQGPQTDACQENEIINTIQNDPEAKNNLIRLLERIQNENSESENNSMASDAPAGPQPTYWNSSESSQPWGSQRFNLVNNSGSVFSPTYNPPPSNLYTFSDMQASSSLLLPYNNSGANTRSPATFQSSLL